MTVSHIFYQLLIKPLEVLFEVIYRYTMIYVDNSGIAIIVMSLVMNLLLLPLYRRADQIREEEHRLEKAMEAGLAHIRQVYHGDERFMMQQTYYRERHYKPYYVLKGLVPLLLEIPFFIAAYHFLSHLGDLNGASFGPIRDLGAPDRLLTISGVSISVMPILMTMINLASAMIYTKGYSRRDKLQLCGMALVFLVLLYRAPAGLVLYWTLNNLFSLVKNIICRIPNYQRVLRILMSVLGIVLLVFALFFYPFTGRILRVLLIVCALLLQIPVLKPHLAERFPGSGAGKPILPEEGSDKLFFLEALFLTLLTGVLIPSAVIQSSPIEFVFYSFIPNPLIHVVDSFLLAAGVFLIWIGVFYGMASPKGKRILTAVFFPLSLAAIADYMFFGTKLGSLSSTLVYDVDPFFSKAEIMINLAAISGIMIAAFLLFRKSRKTVKMVSVLLILAIAGMSVFNISSTQRQLSETKTDVWEKDARCEISKDGQNVVVIMMDRAISCYIPYLFQEKPELKKQFDGFTWYPNTLSFGCHTIFGSPSVFGGYEYTPEEINKRDGEKLVDKHDESLKVMPVLFRDAGYEVTVCDPSHAGYGIIPDLSIYDDYPDIHAYLTERGQYFSPDDNFFKEYLDLGIWERNFFCFSLMKCSPLLLQPVLYQDGSYFNSKVNIRADQKLSCSKVVNWHFANSYAALAALPEIAVTTDDNKDTFLLFCNMTTHETTLLEEPSYTISPIVDNRAYDQEHSDRFTLDGQTLRVVTLRQMQHYQINMAALLQLGRWFDTLRAEGCYDNTRIIIVADHGYYLNQIDSMSFGPEWSDDAMLYNPLLLVKDFNSHGFTIAEDLMTNADTPVLATEGLISDPVNPFTGNPISDQAKHADELHVYAVQDIGVSGDSTRFEEGPWYGVSGDIRDGNNWRFLGEW